MAFTWKAIRRQSNHENDHPSPIDSLITSTMKKSEEPAINATRRMVNTIARNMNLENLMRPSSSDISLLDGGRQLFDGGGRNIALVIFSSLRINTVFHYLMDTLPGEVKLIGDLPERQTGSTHFENFGISANIRRRPWPQWAPLPTRDGGDGFDSISRKFCFSESLAGITNPSSKIDFFALYKFYVNRGNSAVPFPRRELPESIYVHLKTCCVVHGLDSNTHFSNIWEQINFKKSPSSP